MRVLVYKRTHNGDPDRAGRFGAEDCMGEIRAREFDTVIGIGGVGRVPQANGIAGKVNWIGIGPHKTTKAGYKGPIVTFDHFIDFGTDGPELRTRWPKLAQRMYSTNTRHLMDSMSEDERREALKIRRLAENAPPSGTVQPTRRRAHCSTGCKSRHKNKRGASRPAC